MSQLDTGKSKLEYDKLQKPLLRYVSGAIEDYKMIQEGDRRI